MMLILLMQSARDRCKMKAYGEGGYRRRKPVIISVLMIAFLGLGWILSALFICLEKGRNPGKNKWVVHVAGFFMIVGAAGFFGSALSAVGVLNRLPHSFEWPIGFASNILKMENGNIVVPHVPSGRMGPRRKSTF